MHRGPGGRMRPPAGGRMRPPVPSSLVLCPEAVPAVQLDAFGRELHAPVLREPRQDRVERLLLADAGLECLLATEPGGDLQRLATVLTQRREHVDEELLVGQ